MRKWLVVGGVVAAFVAPTAATVSANAAQAKLGTPNCYVLVDYLDTNIVIGGGPPFVSADPEGSVGAEAHCPL